MPQATPSIAAPADDTPLRAVLDTNVVLDWLVFDDPACHALGHAIESGRLRWLATLELRAEFDRVLERGVGAARRPDRARLEVVWRRLSLMCHPPEPVIRAAGLRTRCHCTDRDDQKFIDLALSSGARWLLSRDRAVLKVAREARRSGLAIVAPLDWRIDSSRDWP